MRQLFIAFFSIMFASEWALAVSPVPLSKEFTKPKLTVIDAVNKVDAFRKHFADYPDYYITSVVYGTAEELGYSPRSGGQFQVSASEERERTWFITLTNARENSIRIFRLKPNGKVEELTEIST